MSMVRLLRSSTRILRHSSTPCQRASGHVGPLFSAPKADTYLGFKGRKIPSYTKPIRNKIGHVGVAYDHSKRGSTIMTPGNTIGHVGIPYDHSKSRSTIMVVKASATTTTTSFKEADLLSSITIFTVTGEPVQFKDLWDQNNGMAVVALLRHFGCPCSWELASTLKDVKPKFDAAGVKLIALGVGTPDKAHILAERLPFPMDSLYADPDRKAYNALGLYYGLRRTLFNPASVFRAFESYRKTFKKYSPSAMPEDRSSVLQQGGMYVFKGKELFYARKDEHSGDHAPLDDVLNVCCTVPVL